MRRSARMRTIFEKRINRGVFQKGLRVCRNRKGCFLNVNRKGDRAQSKGAKECLRDGCDGGGREGGWDRLGDDVLVCWLLDQWTRETGRERGSLSFFQKCYASRNFRRNAVSHHVRCVSVDARSEESPGRCCKKTPRISRTGGDHCERPRRAFCVRKAVQFLPGLRSFRVGSLSLETGILACRLSSVPSRVRVGGTRERPPTRARSLKKKKKKGFRAWFRDDTVTMYCVPWGGWGGLPYSEDVCVGIAVLGRETRLKGADTRLLSR